MVECSFTNLVVVDSSPVPVTKTACQKEFLGSSNVILKAFSRLGEKKLPNLEKLKVVETFVCLS